MAVCAISAFASYLLGAFFLDGFECPAVVQFSMLRRGDGSSNLRIPLPKSPTCMGVAMNRDATETCLVVGDSAAWDRKGRDESRRYGNLFGGWGGMETYLDVGVASFIQDWSPFATITGRAGTTTAGREISPGPLFLMLCAAYVRSAS